MSVSVVAHVSVHYETRLIGKPSVIDLTAAISRRGWGSRAEFLGGYRLVSLPAGLGQWVGRATLAAPPSVGELIPLETPFGVLEPVYPLYSRVFFMPRINEL